ncbi:efflux RND transporter periplasmic adaptor subunit, partial [Roseateles sp. GG27B]
IKDDVLSRVSLEIGERDARRGAFVVHAGLAEGDRILRNPSSNLKDGQKVEVAAKVALAASASSSNSAGK